MHRNKKKTERLAAATLLLSLLITAFIWGNSVAPMEASGESSSMIAAFVKSILDPADRVDGEAFHLFVRKLAHFLEFWALGLSVGCFFVQLGKIHDRKYLAMPVLSVLLVALADEYIQMFSGRSSQVSDVVLDFVGALCGLAVMGLIWIASDKGKKG